MSDKKLLVVGVRHRIDEPSLEATVNFINELSQDKKVSIEYDKTKESAVYQVKDIYSNDELNSSETIKLHSKDFRIARLLRSMGILNDRLFFYEIMRHLMRRNISFEIAEDLRLKHENDYLTIELDKLKEKELFLIAEVKNFDHSRIPALYHLVNRKKVIEESEFPEIRKKISILEQKHDELSVKRSIAMHDQAQKYGSDILITGGAHAFDLERIKRDFVDVTYLPKLVVDTIPAVEREAVIKRYLEQISP